MDKGNAGAVNEIGSDLKIVSPVPFYRTLKSRLVSLCKPQCIILSSYLRSQETAKETLANAEKLESCFHLRILLLLRPILGCFKGIWHAS